MIEWCLSVYAFSVIALGIWCLVRKDVLCDEPEAAMVVTIAPIFNTLVLIGVTASALYRKLSNFIEGK